MNSKKLRTAALIAGLAGAAFLIGGFVLGGSSGRASTASAELTGSTATATVSPDEGQITPTHAPEGDINVPNPTDTGSSGGSSPGTGSGGSQVSVVDPLPSTTQPPPVVEPGQPLPPVLEPRPAQPPVIEPEPEQPKPPVVLVVPPTITKTTPAADSTGNTRGTKLQVFFSEPMDKASVNAAFVMVSPVVNGTISWDLEGKVLTFEPAAQFDYGEWVEAKIGAVAKSASGHAMAKDRSTKFRVMRISTVDINGVAAKDGHVYSPAVNATKMVDSSGTRFNVGTWQRGFLSFDLSVLPEDLISITDTSLSVMQSQADAQAYGATTGDIRVESVAYGTLDISDFSKKAVEFCWPSCAPVSYLLSSSSSIGVKSVDVLQFVKMDWENRNEQAHLSQYRLRFEKENNGSGPEVSTEFHSSEGTTKPKLRITYTHP